MKIKVSYAVLTASASFWASMDPERRGGAGEPSKLRPILRGSGAQGGSCSQDEALSPLRAQHLELGLPLGPTPLMELPPILWYRHFSGFTSFLQEISSRHSCPEVELGFGHKAHVITLLQNQNISVTPNTLELLMRPIVFSSVSTSTYQLFHLQKCCLFINTGTWSLQCMGYSWALNWPERHCRPFLNKPMVLNTRPDFATAAEEALWQGRPSLWGSRMFSGTLYYEMPDWEAETDALKASGDNSE